MSPNVLAKTTLAEYFHDAVRATIADMGLKTSQHAEFYLVELLSKFAEQQESTLDEPLAILLKRALESPPDQRVRLLRQMGDTSLYISGFFSESLSRKLIDVDYYIHMGRSAYHQLSGMMQRHRSGDVFEWLFDELSDKFVPFVEVLAEISEQTSLTSNKNIIALYERWLRTKSKRLQKKLSIHGVITDSDTDKWSIN